MTDTDLTLHRSILDIPAADWDACARAGRGRAIDPFTTHRFLAALEHSGSVGPGTGWQPQYLVARQTGQIIAAAPMFAKSHSQGEYIFDQNWADAYTRAGGAYYPKLQIAVPFTPVTGRRFLTRPGFDGLGMAALVQGAIQVAADNGLSSLHATFCTRSEALAGEQMGLLRRLGEQFHWENRDYTSFDDFLSQLSSRKRKMIRKERDMAQAFGGDIVALTGDQITPGHIDAMWAFYQDTGQRKWGRPYLTRDFFDRMLATMAEDLLLVLAIRDGVAIAGALNFIGQDTLFGRYWGCTQTHPGLHFELCYYRAIDYAITHGLQVQAGAQGEHKLARGYLPQPTHSLHWIGNDSFRAAVETYLVSERQAVEHEIEVLTSYGPFRRSHQEDQE